MFLLCNARLKFDFLCTTLAYHFNLDLVIITIRWCALNVKIGPGTAMGYILLSFHGSLMLNVDLFVAL